MVAEFYNNAVISTTEEFFTTEVHGTNLEISLRFLSEEFELSNFGTSFPTYMDGTRDIELKHSLHWKKGDTREGSNWEHKKELWMSMVQCCLIFIWRLYFKRLAPDENCQKVQATDGHRRRCGSRLGYLHLWEPTRMCEEGSNIFRRPQYRLLISYRLEKKMALVDRGEYRADSNYLPYKNTKGRTTVDHLSEIHKDCRARS